MGDCRHGLVKTAQEGKRTIETCRTLGLHPGNRRMDTEALGTERERGDDPPKRVPPACWAHYGWIVVSTHGPPPPLYWACEGWAEALNGN